LERAVLIRVLRRELAPQPDEVQRFWAEAGAAARGAAVAGERVLDAGFDDGDGLPFVVLERPGQTETTVVRPEQTRRSPVWSVRQPKALHGLAIALLLVPVAAGVVLIRGLLGGSVFQPVSVVPLLPTPFAAAQATARPTQPPAQPTPRPTPQPVTLTPAPEQAVRRRIVNTDGQGVALRSSPGGARLPGRGYDEGATVTVLGLEGAWAHIRGDDGRQGWILAVTLG
jgi:hypothetical protein